MYALPCGVFGQRWLAAPATAVAFDQNAASAALAPPRRYTTKTTKECLRHEVTPRRQAGEDFADIVAGVEMSTARGFALAA